MDAGAAVGVMSAAACDCGTVGSVEIFDNVDSRLFWFGLEVADSVDRVDSLLAGVAVPLTVTAVLLLLLLLLPPLVGLAPRESLDCLRDSEGFLDNAGEGGAGREDESEARLDGVEDAEMDAREL